MISSRYRWQRALIAEHRFLAPLADLAATGEIEVLLPPEANLTRTACNGLIAARVPAGRGAFGILFSDFRVNGGSFTKESSAKAAVFLEEMTARSVPVVMILNTIGAGIMEGRTILGDAFSLVPRLLEFQKNNLLVTCATGRCLGLGQLLFAAGHYRLAIDDGTIFNLTGPKVMRLFFGGGEEFESQSSARHQLGRNQLIHEIHPTAASALRRVRRLLEFTVTGFEQHDADSESSTGGVTDAVGAEECNPGPAAVTSAVETLGVEAGDATTRFLELFAGSALEVLRDLSPKVRAFIARRGSRPLGVLINPLERQDNMIDVPTLRKYEAALDLFAALRLPLVSVLDTPGLDPRPPQQDCDIALHLLRVSARLIDYRHGTMGIVAGRGYGGATVLSAPKIFGGRRYVTLKRSHMGIMDERILEEILAGSPTMLESWRRSHAAETADYRDMIEAGLVDACIDESDVTSAIDEFLRSL